MKFKSIASTKVRKALLIAAAVAAGVVANNALVKRAMDANKVVAKARYAEHIKSIESHIARDNDYPPLVTWIDSSGHSASKMLEGLKRMHRYIDGIKYKAKCADGDKEDRYGWVWPDNYPWIYFCNTFFAKIDKHPGWFYHEQSHFNAPHGMGTKDHTYDSLVCKKWAVSDPAKAINTAACVARFISTKPPKPLPSKQQINAAMTAIRTLLL